MCGWKYRALFLVSQAHSSSSGQPSPSSSRSSALQRPSPSGSPGVRRTSRGSVPQRTSSRSDQESPSSSGSSTREDTHPPRMKSGLESPSVSRCAQASNGKSSDSSRYPSLSSSVSHRSSQPSRSASPECRSTSKGVGETMFDVEGWKSL